MFGVLSHKVYVALHHVVFLCFGGYRNICLEGCLIKLSWHCITQCFQVLMSIVTDAWKVMLLFGVVGVLNSNP